VVSGGYRDLFTVIGTSSATLTGLLFVAMSVAGNHSKSHPVIREFRAAASLLAFTNALAVSLFGIVPGNNIGYPAAILGVIGVFFTAAGVRTTLTLPSTPQRNRRQLVLIVILLATFGFELAYGIALLGNSHRTWAVAQIGNILIASLLIGIARAWELVGNWDTGILSSLTLLMGHKSRLEGLVDSHAAPPAGTAAGDEDAVADHGH
jgi:hypothetical protein